MKCKLTKTAVGVLTAVMVLLFGSTSVLAAGSGYGRYYTDTDCDRICDYAETGCPCTDVDNDGLCDRCGLVFSHDGHCRAWSDTCRNASCHIHSASHHGNGHHGECHR